MLYDSAKAALASVPGSLTIGGYDASRLIPNNVLFNALI